MEFQEIRTALILDKNFLDFTLDLAQKLPAEGRIFAIDNFMNIPHITIYNAEYPAESLDEVLGTGENISGLLPINMIVDKFTCGSGYVGISFQKTPELYSFHKAVINTLNHLRCGHIRAKYGDHPNELVIRYGYHLVMEFFKPHLTLGRFKTDLQADKAVSLLSRKFVPNFVVNKFAHAETGDNGTVTKILKSYSSANS